MKKLLLGFILILSFSSGTLGADSPVSEDSEICIECHASLHPGIVQDWLKSRHAKVSPAQALSRPKLERRISVEKVPERFANGTVGCAECHTMNEDTHQDSFEHNDYQVHTVVTPNDCAVCHEAEAQQQNLGPGHIQQRFACQQRQQRLRQVIQARGLGTGGQAQPAFAETR